jgi:hypothetical protein
MVVAVRERALADKFVWVSLAPASRQGAGAPEQVVAVAPGRVVAGEREEPVGVAGSPDCVDLDR